MASHDLAVEVQELIESLSSVEQLEVLMLMRKSPSRVYEIDALANELGWSGLAIERALEALVSRRLVVSVHVEPGRIAYQYAPGTVALHAAVEGLAMACGTHSVAIIKTLQDGPNRALRNFADAFRIRRS